MLNVEHAKRGKVRRERSEELAYCIFSLHIFDIDHLLIKVKHAFIRTAYLYLLFAV
jgi:hypothetical protein